jgi:hypothetical protein
MTDSDAQSLPLPQEIWLRQVREALLARKFGLATIAQGGAFAKWSLNVASILLIVWAIGTFVLNLMNGIIEISPPHIAIGVAGVLGVGLTRDGVR